MPDLLNHIEHRCPQTHAYLAVIKSRNLLVQMRTRMVTRIRALSKSVGVALVDCDATDFLRKTRPQLPAELLPACEALFDVLEDLHVKIREIDK